MGSIITIASARQNRALTRAFPVMAGVYGQKLGVKVRVGGSSAYYDGEVVNLPMMTLEEPSQEWLEHERRHGRRHVADQFLERHALKKKLMDAAFGFLAHECGHVRWTDMAVFRSAVIPLRTSILNVIEDIRIETLMRQAFPGTRDTLLAVVDYLLASGGLELATEETHPAGILQGYLLYSLRCDVLGQDQLAHHADQSEVLLDKAFPEGACTRLKALLQTVPRLESTRDALTLTDDILKMLKDEEEKEQQKQQQKQQQNDDDDQDAQGGSGQPGDTDDQEDDDQDDSGRAGGQPNDQDDDSEESGASGNAGAQSDDDTSSSEQDDQGATGNGGDQETASGEPGGKGASDGGAAEQLESLQKALAAGSGDLEEDMMDKLKDILSDHAEPNTGPWDCNMAYVADDIRLGPRSGNEILSIASQESAQLRAKLQGLIQASQASRLWHTSSGQRLSANRLARMRTGDNRIFKQAASKVTPNAAFQILIDDSGSMYSKVEMGGREATMADIAKEAALALALALEAIKGVTVGATVFPAQDDSAVWDVLKHKQSVRHAVSNFAAASCGGTPMTGALWHCARTLLTQKGANKVILVLTDGDPNCVPSARDIIKRCQDSGIRVIGIGIQHPGVERLFDESVVINQLSDLRHEMFRLAQQSLIG